MIEARGSVGVDEAVIKAWADSLGCPDPIPLPTPKP